MVIVYAAQKILNSSQTMFISKERWTDHHYEYVQYIYLKKIILNMKVQCGQVRVQIILCIQFHCWLSWYHAAAQLFRYSLELTAFSFYRNLRYQRNRCVLPTLHGVIYYIYICTDGLPKWWGNEGDFVSFSKLVLVLISRQNGKGILVNLTFL